MVFNSPATIKDVAKMANVSTATVSRVINDTGAVSDSTRTRVLRAIQELGYESQRPRTKSPDTPWLAILTETIKDPFFSEVIAGIYQQALDEAKFPIILEMPNSGARQLNIIRRLNCLPIIGVISAGFFQSPQSWLDWYRDIKVPIVVMNTLVHHPKITSVRVNFEQAAYRATQHLLNLNHTRIAYLAYHGVPDYEEFSLSEYQGIKKALEEVGLEYPAEYQNSVSLTPEGASQGISRLMMLPPDKRPTAICAFDDIMAIYAISSIRNHGLRVPEDISVIGFDNIMMAAHTNPPLTTVHIPKHRIGQQMVHILNQLMENSDKPIGFTYVDGSLVVRESTCPAPSIY